MKYRGVVYDTGLRFEPSMLSVEPFDPALVEYDMAVIANDLHANAVRIEGEAIDRLEIAARAAHANGLSVFLNPWKMNIGPEETRDYLAQVATLAEQLRTEGVDLVFVLGCEFTIFTDGIFPGSSWAERGQFLGEQTGGDLHGPSEPSPEYQESMSRLDAALRQCVSAVRARFHGPITYSSGTWEKVDWDLFDIVGLDFYRRGESEQEYLDGLEAYRLGKPIAALELGCCAYEGAAVKGDGGFVVLQGANPDGSGIWEGGVVPTRSEKEQAEYVERQLELLSGTDVEAAFIFVFSFPAMRYGGEGAKDLDMANFAIVKTFGWDDPRASAVPNWEPKEAFHRVAEVYGRLASASAP